MLVASADCRVDRQRPRPLTGKMYWLKVSCLFVEEPTSHTACFGCSYHSVGIVSTSLHRQYVRQTVSSFVRQISRSVGRGRKYIPKKTQSNPPINVNRREHIGSKEEFPTLLFDSSASCVQEGGLLRRDRFLGGSGEECTIQLFLLT